MNLDYRWIYATLAIITGLVAGAAAGQLSRRQLTRSTRRPALQAIAAPTGTFLFWLCIATGIITAVGFTAPDTLRPIPTDLLEWLPRVLAAGLILLAGYAAGGALSAVLATGTQRALGHRSSALELATRWAVMAAATILAMTNLGVETTTLQILVAGAVLTATLTASLLAGLGGQDIAKNVAAGRVLHTELRIGDQLTTTTTTGKIIALHPTVVVVQDPEAKTVISYATLLSEPFQIRPADDPPAQPT